MMFYFPEDPHVHALCERFGYGAVMHRSAAMWARKSDEMGLPGGNHTIGPCAALMVPCPCEGRHSCDWCCGTCMVTERVRQAIEEAERK